MWNKLWVVVPAHNEAGKIGKVVDDLLLTFPHVVVVNDGSQDGTGEVAWRAGATVVDHPFNLGQGAALQTGFDLALARGAELVATFDADGQHDPADIAILVERLRETGAEVALGSRFLGEAENLGAARRALLKFAILFQKATTGLHLTDAHNGLRVLTRGALEKIRIRQDRMAHASEIIAEIARQRIAFVEVPCTIRYTDYSRAKGQRLAGAFQIVLDLTMRRLYR